MQLRAFENYPVPRNQTLNEDKTCSLHFTPQLHKHFVVRRWFTPLVRFLFLQFALSVFLRCQLLFCPCIF